MIPYIVLLRSVNVGPNKLPMADLKSFLERCGFASCQTLLQSGNAVMLGKQMPTQDVEGLLAKRAERELTFKTAFFVKTLDQWARVISENPFPDAAGSDPSHLLVHFFKEAPDPDAVNSIQSSHSGPERLQAIRDRVYVTYPEGIARTALTKNRPWVKLSAASTARNWNTILKLRERAQSASSNR